MHGPIEGLGDSHAPAACQRLEVFPLLGIRPTNQRGAIPADASAQVLLHEAQAGRMYVSSLLEAACFRRQASMEPTASAGE